MALPLSVGLVPKEVAFLCEMETVTVVPRQRLESIDLLAGASPALRPPQRSSLPLWLALLLKRQRRANILPPNWLLSSSLEKILSYETETSSQAFPPLPPYPRLRSDHISSGIVSSPFIPSSTVEAADGYLPYHWLELGEILLEACPDDIPEAGRVRALLRDLREVRMAKMRGSVTAVEGGGITSLNGVGAMEISEGRGFIVGVMDGLRRLGASREVARRDREVGEGNGGAGSEGEGSEMDFE